LWRLELEGVKIEGFGSAARRYLPRGKLNPARKAESMSRKDLLSRLADAGEEAMQKLAETPGADRITGFAQATRDRMDELQKRVRGLDALEQRVAAIEKRLDALARDKATKVPSTRKSASTAKRKTGTTRRSSAKSAAKRSTSKSASKTTGGASPG
jgi:hypothetical protein